MNWDRVASIATILTCSAICAHLLVVNRRAQPADSRQVPQNTAYKVGERIVDTPTLGLAGARSTLILMTASSCHYCTASMDSFDRLTKTAHKVGVRVVAATSEDAARNRAYLQEHGVEADVVAAAEKNNIDIRATPTLLLVDQHGTIRNVWVGQFTPAREADVAKLLVIGAPEGS